MSDVKKSSMVKKNNNQKKKVSIIDQRLELISEFLKSNFEAMTNQELAMVLGLPLNSVRVLLYRLGLYRMKLEYWTEPQIKFLIKNYRRHGDVELARMFRKKWRKSKPWTIKHIEKKRMYLGLKRTPEEIKRIKENHVKAGVYEESLRRRWELKSAKEGDIRQWEGPTGPYLVIKHKRRFINYNRYLWRKHFGRIPKNILVCYKDGDPLHCTPENLVLKTRGQHCTDNAKVSRGALSDNYVLGTMCYGDKIVRQAIKRHQPILIEIKRASLLTKRIIKNYL